MITMATGIKFDDGKGGYATNCFPVRSLAKQNDDGGAWLVAHTAEQRRRFKAVLCTKPARTYSQIREERKRAEKTGSNIVPPVQVGSSDDEEEEKTLDGFFLMKHCCVEDPSDLCSVNISGESLTEVKEEDFSLFDNVAYVNAAENILPLHAFRYFPIIRELEISLNAIRNIKLESEDFPHLEMLDLSYNNLSSDDILILGSLPKLRVLHLSGNNIKSIPADISLPPRIDSSSEEKMSSKGRYGQLEVLLLDDNHISDVNIFASLAGLKRLRHLNIAKNSISTIPQLMLVEGRHVPTALGSANSKGHRKRSARKTPRSARKLKKAERRSTKKKPHGTSHLNPTFPADIETLDAEITDSASNLNLEELNLEELDQKVAEVIEETEKYAKMSASTNPVNDVSERIEEEEVDIPLVKEDTFEMIDVNRQETQAPPFPELVHINLSHNQIKDEESLLAVAAWPMLSELIIHDNPLTTENAGDPPLLKQFLQERLGIRIQRKRSIQFVKPPVEIQAKPERKVQIQVPKVPKQDVEAIIAAIEAPLRRPALPPSSAASVTTPPPSLERHTPLPPIPSTPKERNGEDEDKYEGDAFFMTQVEDTETLSKRGTPATPEKLASKEANKEKKNKIIREEEKKKYKGYEDLLDIEEDILEDEELPRPQDVQGNVRALKYTLDHPIVFRDHDIRLDKPQKPYEPYTRDKVEKEMACASPHVVARLPKFSFEKQYKDKSRKKAVKKATAMKTKTNEASELIENMRTRQTVVEEELAKVLLEKQKYKDDFKNAGQLLGQLKASYFKDASDSESENDAQNSTITCL